MSVSDPATTPDKIRERLNAATPGEWMIAHWNPLAIYMPGDPTPAFASATVQADAELIAHAPSDISYLLEQRDNALKQLDVLQVEMTETWNDWRGHGEDLSVDLLSDSTIRMDAVEFRKLIASFGYRFSHNVPKSSEGAAKLKAEQDAVRARHTSRARSK